MTPSPLRKIVVGIDGSDSATTALQWAGALAGAGGGVVTALVAWTYPTAMLMPVVGTPVLPADFVATTARENLRQIVAATPLASIEVQENIVMGAPRMVLTEASEANDLLVLGRTGNSRLKQIFLGSTVSYCVRHADCPVVVVRDSVAPEHKITVAVDGSPSSIEALVWAIGLGEGHEILVAYSHDEWELDDLALDAQVRADLDDQADRLLVDSIAKAIERTGADEARIKRQVFQGDPRTTLVDQAEPDHLLVLGAQGHSGIARWMLGSLADYAVSHAPGTVAVWR